MYYDYLISSYWGDIDFWHIQRSVSHSLFADLYTPELPTDGPFQSFENLCKWYALTPMSFNDEI